MDLVQIFSYKVIPKVIETDNQTPELRSMLTKKIYFQSPISIGEVNDVYDGEEKDKLFKIGQEISALRKKISTLSSNYSGSEERQEPWYERLLYTIYFEANNQSEGCQRAVAWAIKNKTDQNMKAKMVADSIEKVCLERECWQVSHLSNLFDEKHRDEDLEEIDRWLPNVFEELGGHDFSMNSTDFNNDSRTRLDSTKQIIYVTTIKIGNIQFYKEAATTP